MAAFATCATVIFIWSANRSRNASACCKMRRTWFGPQNSRRVSRDQVLKDLPPLQSRGLRGGIRYFDGQFDDARLAVCLARTLDELGGVPVNYFRVESLLRPGGRVHRVAAR